MSVILKLEKLHQHAELLNDTGCFEAATKMMPQTLASCHTSILKTDSSN